MGKLKHRPFNNMLGCYEVFGLSSGEMGKKFLNVKV